MENVKTLYKYFSIYFLFMFFLIDFYELFYVLLIVTCAFCFYLFTYFCLPLFMFFLCNRAAPSMFSYCAYFEFNRLFV